MALNLLAMGICFIIISAAYFWRKYARFSQMLDHIPGPEGQFVVGNALQIKDPTKLHYYLYKCAKECGPVFKMRMVNKYYILLSDLESLQELYLAKGHEMSGRYTTYRLEVAWGTNGLLISPPTVTWKALRKTAHRHLKQFGKGMNELEYLITAIGEDMFQTIGKFEGSPYDPYPVIFETALKNLAFLITGQHCKSGDVLLQQMKEYERVSLEHVGNVSRPQYALIDAFPLLRYMFRGTWKNVCRCPELANIVWQEVKERIRGQEDKGLAGLLLSHTNTSEFSSEEILFTDGDAKRACLDILFAGIATTSQSFYAMVNILAHHPAVQCKLADEITETVGVERNVSLDDRVNLPYARAVILELTRYFTVAILGVGHSPVTNGVTIKGYSIPRDRSVIVFPNPHALHHDRDFWDDPDLFQPERFLDDDGQLVPADHPNRTHLLPFGSGPRVCLGESLALARLFLWTTILVQRFTMTPAKGNDKYLATNDGYYYEGILYSQRYNVIFKRRP